MLTLYFKNWKKKFFRNAYKCLFFLSPESRVKVLHSKWVLIIALLWLVKNIPILFILIRKLSLSLVIGFICFFPAFGQLLNSDVSAGHYWYERRGVENDGQFANSENINKALAYYKKAMVKESAYEEASSSLLASLYYKYKFVPGDKSEKARIIDEGKIHAEKLLQTDPRSGPALYWCAIVIATWVEHHGVLKGVSSGKALELKGIGEKAMKADPTYRAGGPYRFIAVLNLYTPKIPLVMNWPSNEKAIQLFNEAAIRFPDHPGNWLGLAKCYLKIGEVDKAVPILERVALFSPRNNYLVEDMQLINEARSLHIKYASIISKNVKLTKK